MNPSFFYSQSRIWFGITSIGGNLFLPWVFYFLIHEKKLLLLAQSSWGICITILSYFSSVFILNFSWDLFTGYFWEKKFNRYLATLQTWLCHWLIGSLSILSLQCTGGLILALSAFYFPKHSLLSLVSVDACLLFFAWSLHHWHFHWIPSELKKAYYPNSPYREELEQELLKRGFSMQKNPNLLYFYQSEDCSSVNGGSIGGAHQRHYMISSASVEYFTPRELALLIWRDECLNPPSEKFKHLLLALIYCFLGLLLAQSSMIFAAHSLWERWFWLLAFLSSWFFLALFIFPSYCRKNYLRVDRQVLQSGVNADEYILLLKKLQLLNLSEQEIPSWIESIFHPIPSLANRLKNLTEPDRTP